MDINESSSIANVYGAQLAVLLIRTVLIY